MDSACDDSREKLIEDYLFSGYHRPSYKSSSDKDENFAKPIEDEDIFGESAPLTENPAEQSEECAYSDIPDPELDDNQDDLDDLDEDDDDESDVDDDEHGGLAKVQDDDEDIEILGIEDLSSSSSDVVKNNTSVDDMFPDDYSNSSPASNENLQPKVVPKPNQRVHMTVAQIKMMQLKQKILEQAKNIKPKKLGSGFDQDGTIEVTIEYDTPISDSNSKFIFNKLSNKPKRALDLIKSPESKNTSREDHIVSLRKRICSQKRQVWESLRQPAEEMDEEDLLEDMAAGKTDTGKAAEEDDPIELLEEELA